MHAPNTTLDLFKCSKNATTITPIDLWPRLTDVFNELETVTTLSI